MAFSTLVSYSAGLGFLRSTDRRAPQALPGRADHGRSVCCSASSSTPSSASRVARRSSHAASARDLHVPVASNIILPVGISFYTFHTITLHRGLLPRRHQADAEFFEFSAYVSLFSQLVAGPIVRFRQIEEDLENARHRRPHGSWLALGISFFIVGFVEKVLIADTIAGFIDPALRITPRCRPSATWLAMLGYTFQLYFDFSGYSDMAVGLGYLFGMRIPQNFNSPYKARRSVRFLATLAHLAVELLRDYLYIPLGGNRGGELADLPQPDAHDAHRRPVARGVVDVRRVGRIPRNAARPLTERGERPGIGCRPPSVASARSCWSWSDGCSFDRRVFPWPPSC